MNKTFHVALREFLATVLTKGFIIGIFLPPVLIGFVLTLMPILMNQKPPKTEGRVAVIDQSGLVGPMLDSEFTPEKLAQSGRRKAQQVKEQAKKFSPTPMQQQQVDMALSQAIGQTPDLTLEALGKDANVDAAKKEIPTTRRRDELIGSHPRLALVVIPPSAITPKPPAADSANPDEPLYASFELYTAPTLDVEVKDQIEEAAGRAIVNARIKADGMDVSKVRALLERPRSSSVTVTTEGERKTNDAAALLIPGAFMFLLWISVFSAGQSLLTSTIEEKASRVMEVLLSAASPMQIMVGKVIGQMGVGMLIMLLYGSAGIAALVAFAMNHLIDPMNLIYVAVYFVIAFFLIACMMAAIGSAVSELREAQTLMGPVMIVLMLPMLLWMPILRNPNSTFAQVCSFVPPISPFVMVLRLGGSEPVPFWQIPVSMAIGAVSVVIAAWAASKIFRIGVLMYGKPPNFRTLVSWVRMA